MKTIYYFRDEDSERCYPLKTHLEQAKEDGLTEIELFTAIPEKVAGFRWCHAVDDIAESEYCGKCCEFYEPRNKKSGICKHQGSMYEPDKKVKFKVPIE